MDEIICPKCGKANLLSEKKCRYCQAPFENPESGNSTEIHAEAEIPEWLKRIRELKIMDEEREKEKEKWRQQTLFGQNNDQQKQKSKTPEIKSEPLKPIQNSPVGQAKSSRNPKKPNIPEDKPPIRSENNVGKKAASADDGLPEGFQPLTTDEDNPKTQGS